MSTFSLPLALSPVRDSQSMVIFFCLLDMHVREGMTPAGIYQY